MNQKSVTLGYTSCDAHRTQQAICVSGSERLLRLLQALHKSAAAAFSIQPTERLGADEPNCAIALRASGQPPSLLGNLTVEDENLEATTAVVIASSVAGA